MSSKRTRRTRAGAGTLETHKEYHAEVSEWLADHEMTQAELAGFLRLSVAELRGALTGQAVRPWVHERIRSTTGIEAPADDRPISNRKESTRRYRALLALLPEIEEGIRSSTGRRTPRDQHEIRLGMIGDLRELSSRAGDFADWLEVPLDAK